VDAAPDEKVVVRCSAPTKSAVRKLSTHKVVGGLKPYSVTDRQLQKGSGVGRLTAELPAVVSAPGTANEEDEDLRARAWGACSIR
jgi:hypothetical protein